MIPTIDPSILIKLAGSGWKLLKRFWPYLVIALLVGLFLLTAAQRKAALADLAQADAWRADMAQLLSCSSNDQLTVGRCARSLVQTSHNRGQALDQISQQAREAEQRSRQADERMRADLEIERRRFAAAQRTIQELRGRRPTGNAEQDLRIIEEDSQAAWRGWR